MPKLMLFEMLDYKALVSSVNPLYKEKQNLFFMHVPQRVTHMDIVGTYMKVDIKKVASLARLKLAENKEQEIERQIEGILDYFAQIQQINTDGIEPLVTPHEMAVVFRDDEALKDTEFAEEILQQAPEVKGRLVKVPPVVGGDS